MQSRFMAVVALLAVGLLALAACRQTSAIKSNGGESYEAAYSYLQPAEDDDDSDEPIDVNAYYAPVREALGPQLRAMLHAMVSGKPKLSYAKCWDVLSEADAVTVGADDILDLYRNLQLHRDARTRQTNVLDHHSRWEREHVWPNSYGFNDVSSSHPYTDCHALFACNAYYNNQRSNRYFTVAGRPPLAAATVTEYETGTTGGASGVNKTIGSESGGGWEVWPDRRGDVARAIFYMDIRYEGGVNSASGSKEPDLRVTNDHNLIKTTPKGQVADVAYMGLLNVLLEWHQADPVDDRERRRNDVVFKHQNNRNPFIDRPEWVTWIFQAE